MTDRPASVPRVDLHLHTTASDGRCTPSELVERVRAAGITVMAVTDHDTTDGVRDAQARGAELGVAVVPGIEITAVEEGRDVHMLAYFVDADDPALAAFLRQQRLSRVTRVQAIGARLAELGMPVDLGAVIAEAQLHAHRSIGRPQVARAMIAKGYVADMRQAFDRWLGQDAPAFVPRAGVAPEEVVAVVHRAGGLVSLAHPGRTRIDHRIAALRDAGLDALEVYHSDHDASDVARYHEMALALGLLASGGSDYHGDPSHGVMPGVATLPAPEWERLSAARHRHAVR